MRTTLKPTGRSRVAIAATWGLLAGAAGAATQTHTASFKGSGGDARFGYGATDDPTFNLALYDVLPLFDASLGTLERVSFSLSGWRSFDGVCTVVPNHPDAAGACTARIDGAFTLEAMNLNVWPQTAPMAQIRTVINDYTTVWPPLGGSLPINLVTSDNTTGKITDAGVLSSFFTESGLANHGISPRFAPWDGGYFGYGGGPAFLPCCGTPMRR